MLKHVGFTMMKNGGLTINHDGLNMKTCDLACKIVAFEPSNMVIDVSQNMVSELSNIIVFKHKPLGGYVHRSAMDQPIVLGTSPQIL